MFEIRVRDPSVFESNGNIPVGTRLNPGTEILEGTVFPIPTSGHPWHQQQTQQVFLVWLLRLVQGDTTNIETAARFSWSGLPGR